MRFITYIEEYPWSSNEETDFYHILPSIAIPANRGFNPGDKIEVTIERVKP